VAYFPPKDSISSPTSRSTSWRAGLVQHHTGGQRDHGLAAAVWHVAVAVFNVIASDSRNASVSPSRQSG